MKTLYRPILLSLLMAAAFSVSGQSNIAVGEKAPAITVTDWYHNVPADKNLDGKHLVLEFWATWCGPCISAVPHLNSLKQKFSSDSLYFLSITDESKAKVDRILKRVDFQTMVVGDQTKATQIVYGDGKKGLERVPFTVLVDSGGIIRWIGSPTEMDGPLLTALLDGTLEKSPEDFPSVKKKYNTAVSREAVRMLMGKEVKELFEMVPTEEEKTGGMKKDDSAMYFASISLEDVFVDLLKVPAAKLSLPAALADQRYRLFFKTADKAPLELLEASVIGLLGLRKETQAKEREVVELHVPEKNMLEEALDKRMSSMSFADDKVLLNNISLDDMVGFLNKSSAASFFELKGSVEGTFDFVISTGDVEATLESLKSYGIIGKTKRKKVESIVLHMQ